MPATTLVVMLCGILLLSTLQYAVDLARAEYKLPLLAGGSFMLFLFALGLCALCCRPDHREPATAEENRRLIDLEAGHAQPEAADSYDDDFLAGVEGDIAVPSAPMGLPGDDEALLPIAGAHLEGHGRELLQHRFLNLPGMPVLITAYRLFLDWDNVPPVHEEAADEEAAGALVRFGGAPPAEAPPADPHAADGHAAVDMDGAPAVNGPGAPSWVLPSASTAVAYAAVVPGAASAALPGAATPVFRPMAARSIGLGPGLAGLPL